jgi:hypothetical protein
MNQVLDGLSRFYSNMTILYPYEFRQEFGCEMQMVFLEKMIAQKKIGTWNLWRTFLKELRGLPIAILTEYWLAFQDTFGRGIMFLITEDKSWRIEDRRDAIIASLPPTMVGFGIALGALVVWKPWYTIPHWRLMTGFTIMMLPGLIIGLGGLWALIKRVPPWGHIWIGAAGMGLVLFVKTIAEERADFGLPIISPVIDNVIAIILLIGIVVLIGISAWQGWRHAGMVSLGFASMAGMASFSMATAAPFNRYDLALLAAPVGLIMVFTDISLPPQRRWRTCDHYPCTWSHKRHRIFCCCQHMEFTRRKPITSYSIPDRIDRCLVGRSNRWFGWQACPEGDSRIIRLTF